MKYRLREVIDSIDYPELVKMNADIDQGGYHLKQLLHHKIKEYQKEHASSCSTCGNLLEPSSVNNFSLLFGPEDFKKRASFCGMDCLHHFLKELAEIKATR